MPQSPYLPEHVASARHLVLRGHPVLSAMAATDAHEIRAVAWAVASEDFAALHPRPAPTGPARVIRIPRAVFQMGRRCTQGLHIAQPVLFPTGGDAA